MQAFLEEIAVFNLGEGCTFTLSKASCVFIQSCFDLICSPLTTAFVSSRNLVVMGVDARPGHVKKMALKIGLPGHAANYENELHVMRKVSCETVPPIYTQWKLENGLEAFSMPWYNVCLFDLIASERVTCVLAWRVVAAISRALLHEHSQSVSHCDLKSENVFMEDSSGRGCVLGDWDLACDGKQTEMASYKTGTLEYNPPASFGMSDVSFDADAFRLGALMYSMLVGVTPVWESSTGLLGVSNIDNFVCLDTFHKNFLCRKYEVILLRLLAQGGLPPILLVDVYAEALENIFK